MLPSVPLIFDAFVAVALPVIAVPVGKPQVNNVPPGTIPLVPSVGVSTNDAPLQIVVVIVVICAFGFNVTVTENTGAFPQAAVLGVIV